MVMSIFLRITWKETHYYIKILRAEISIISSKLTDASVWIFKEDYSYSSPYHEREHSFGSESIMGPNTIFFFFIKIYIDLFSSTSWRDWWWGPVCFEYFLFKSNQMDGDGLPSSWFDNINLKIPDGDELPSRITEVSIKIRTTRTFCF